MPPLDGGEFEEPWLRAADRYVGGPVGGAVILAATEDVAIVVHHMAIDPLGLSLRLTTLRATPPEVPTGAEAGRAFWAVSGDPWTSGLRFAIGLPNGTVVELDDVDYFPEGDDDEADQHRFELRSEGGTGAGGRWEQDLRLVPMPEPGPLTLGCTWPQETIDETTAAVAAEDIAAGLRAAVLLWPERPLPADETSGERWFNYSPD